MSDGFKPPWSLRSPHLQSLLNSSSLRRRLATRRAADLLAVEQELQLDGGSGIRLVGHFSPQSGSSKGLVVLLHGWEGSSRSNYVLGTGARLFANGYDVFRLNFRDHGDTHHLNEGIFHSCRLDEVIHALGDMQKCLSVTDWGIAGYSLGGNFALRVARHGPERGLSIARVIGVCPVLDPANVLKAMEDGPTFYESYYVRKWGRSVRVKQQCFPERYAYDEWFELPGLRARTEYFATRYYHFGSLAAYFDGYSIAGDRLLGLEVPGTLLTAADDPVVPVSDAYALPEIPGLELLVTRYGGHCGYLTNWKLDSWAEDLILDRFGRDHEASQPKMSEQVA
jgi:predicted alpha/beta-fold hydrolase